MTENPYQEKAEELDAEDIYTTFRLRNIDDLEQNLEQYNGDKEQLGELLLTAVEELELYWGQFEDINEQKDRVFSLLANHFGRETAAKIIALPPKDEETEEEIEDGVYADKEKGTLKIFTDNFRIFINNPRRLQDDEIRAHVHCTPTHMDDGREYDEQVKMTRYSTRDFAKQVLENNQLMDRDTSEKLQKEIRANILSNKSILRDIIREKHREKANGSNLLGGNKNREDVELNTKRAIKIIYDAIEDEKDHVPPDYLLEAGVELDNLGESEYILNVQDDYGLTEAGIKKGEELADTMEFTSEEEIQEKAEEILVNDFLSYYLESVDKLHKGDYLLKLWELISALSANSTNQQIHSWAVGPSGKGKSNIKRCLINYYLPENTYVKLSSFSPQALLYLAEEEGPDVLKNKLLFLDEADTYDDEGIIPLLRSLTDTDEDELTRLTVRDQTAEELRLEKPITVWFTSVESINDEQLKNRFILTNPDGGQDLDRKVFEFQKKLLHRGKKLKHKPSESPVIKKAVQKIRDDTDGLELVIPFDVNWKQEYNRRLYPIFTTLVELITKIHYRNRKIENGKIVATRSDFELASEIWAKLVATTVAQVDKDALKLVEVLPETRENQMTTSELAMELDGFTTGHAKRKADMLMKTEKLALINGEKEGNKWRYWAGKDREKLVDPEPEFIDDRDEMRSIIIDAGMEWGEEMEDYILESECPVIDTLQNMELAGTGNDFNVGNQNIEHNLDDFDEDEEDIEYIQLYPDDPGTDMTIEDVMQNAMDKLDVTEEEFQDIHDTLREDGEIYEAQPGKWVRI